jgi:hypothetical protein
MRPLLVRILAALACAGAGSIGTIGLASSCSGPEHKPELPNPASPHGSPPQLSPTGTDQDVPPFDAPVPLDARPPERS